MPAEPMHVEQPQHPTSQLTTSELNRYRRQLEHSLKALPTQATVRTQLQARLAALDAHREVLLRCIGSGGTGSHPMGLDARPAVVHDEAPPSCCRRVPSI